MNALPGPEHWSDPDFIAFLQNHVREPVTDLAFRFRGKTTFDLPLALEQIRLRQKATNKLPEWAEAGCLFSALSMEQCSSSLTARWKSARIRHRLQCQKLLDCNGGLGVDATFFAQQGIAVTALEQESRLAALCRYNQDRVGVSFPVVEAECLSWLHDHPDLRFDLIYADPDRRDAAGNRQADPDALNPPVSGLVAASQGIAPQLLIKLSPMFDSGEGKRLFPGLKEIWFLSVSHECREILYLLESGYSGPVNHVSAAWFSGKWHEGEGTPRYRSDPDDESPNPYVYRTDVAFSLAGLTPGVPGVTAIVDRGQWVMAERELTDFPGVEYRMLERFSTLNKAAMSQIKMRVPGPFLDITTKGTREKPEVLLRQLNRRPGGNHLLVVRPGNAGVWLLERL